MVWQSLCVEKRMGKYIAAEIAFCPFLTPPAYTHTHITSHIQMQCCNIVAASDSKMEMHDNGIFILRT